MKIKIVSAVALTFCLGARLNQTEPQKVVNDRSLAIKLAAALIGLGLTTATTNSASADQNDLDNGRLKDRRAPAQLPHPLHDSSTGPNNLPMVVVSKDEFDKTIAALAQVRQNGYPIRRRGRYVCHYLGPADWQTATGRTSDVGGGSFCRPL